jgi:SAM-dependent methyltransferase
MQGYGPSTYGDRWADIYDDWTQQRLGAAVTQAAIDGLAELADGGRVLELAIGTGRIALGLVERGLEVHGLDASEEMVARLRAKPGGEDLPVTIGDFADVGVDGRFDVVFVAFNTFFALTTQDDQIRCFENVARHLTDDGVFAIEAFVPDPARFDRDQTLRTMQVTTDLVDLEASTHDAVSQTVSVQRVVISARETSLRPVHLRYAWPSELDLMARLAGLALRQRWAGWDRAAFTGSSAAHVSVYGRRRPV